MTAERFRFGIFEALSKLAGGAQGWRVGSFAVAACSGVGCLLESAGQVVSREELRLAMWHEDTFIDFEQWWKRKCPGTANPHFASSLLFEITLVAHRVQVPRYLPRRQHQPVLFRVSLPL